MAIVYEKYAPGLVRAYSDTGLYISNLAGDVYYEAVDPEEKHRTYVETETEIEIEPDKALRIISGEDPRNDDDGDVIDSSEEALYVILGGAE